MFTPAVLAAQEHYCGRRAPVTAGPEFDPLKDEEREFIAARDSFYIASVTEAGWPYVQHRGGKPGFLRVLGQKWTPKFGPVAKLDFSGFAWRERATTP